MCEICLAFKKISMIYKATKPISRQRTDKVKVIYIKKVKNSINMFRYIIFSQIKISFPNYR